MTRNLIALLVGVPLLGCGGTTTPTPTVTTFTTLKSTVLTPSCAFSDSCHSAKGAKGLGVGLDLATDPYNALVKGATTAPAYPKLKTDYPALVVPGNADKSALYIKLALPTAMDANYGFRMPQSNAALDAATLAEFKSWIDGGALND